MPQGDPPAAGWPVVIYQHGTGGDYTSFVGDGSAREAAKVTDAHGNRHRADGHDRHRSGAARPARRPPGTDYDTAFFNFLNLPAAHDNPKQGALDDFQRRAPHPRHRRRRCADDGQAASSSTPSRIYFKGHSQGGLTGPLFLAAEPEVKAAILSGAGAVLI